MGSVLLTALAIGSATLGPVFQQAVTNSYLVTRLDQAPNPLTGLTWTWAPVAGQGATEVIDLAEADADQAAGPFAPARARLETDRYDALGGEVHADRRRRRLRPPRGDRRVPRRSPSRC